jgi:oxygen-dependent protoporphyrinogen oxidase
MSSRLACVSGGLLIRPLRANVNEQPTPPRRVAVVGGGISGLAAAHRLLELDPSVDVTLLESSPRLGGVLSTVHEDGYQVEESADNFITTVPWGVNLCKRLGLGEQLVQTNPAHRRTFVIRGGRLHRLPDGFLMMAPSRMWPLAVTPILSPGGKLRAAMEYVIPPRTDDHDESMADFVCRRLGREVFERLVEPLVSAVYAADMEKLSVLATLPRFREMEREHGSLIRAMRRQVALQRKPGGESGARYSMFVTLQAGLTSLIDAIAKRLPPQAVRLQTPVQRIQRVGNTWQLELFGDGQESFDAVILATPSHVTGRLLASVDPELSELLGRVEHSGTAVVTVAYRREQIAHPLDGMGFVVPAVEESPILAVSFSSQKYPHRAPDGRELLRAFVGGARREELAEMPTGKLVPMVLAELDRLLGIQGSPIYRSVAHWPSTMPQYHVGHRELVAQIDARVALLPNVALAGNAYHGVGIPNCIHSGEQAAEAVLGK